MYENRTSYFYCFNKSIEVLHQDIDTPDKNNIIEIFKLKDKDLENGFYQLSFYIKDQMNNEEISKIKIYKYEFELEKITEYSSELHILINKLNNKIKDLEDKIKKQNDE